MSGGAFEYKQFIINEIAERIEDIVIKNNLPIPKECLDSWDRVNYDSNNPPKYSEYSKEVIDELKKGVEYLNIASIYAHRIDYLISCDDGEEMFLKRLKKELEDFKNSFKL